MHKPRFTAAPALVVPFLLLACGTHTPGDPCTANDPALCDSSTAMLQCILGSYVSIPCAGPAGCVASGPSVSCDTSVAVAGTACPPAATGSGTACQASPSATLACVNGVWQQQQACTSCSVQNGQAVCAGGTGGGTGGGAGGGTGGAGGCTPDTCLDGCCANGQCIKAPLNVSATFCGAPATYCSNCASVNKTCDQATFSCISPATGGGAGGGTGGGAGGTGGTGGSTVFPGAHPSYPTALSYGGPVLSAPKFISITFSNDTPSVVSAADGFISTIGGTAYWAAIASEYGVGAATAAAPIHLTETAPANIDDSQIGSWLAGKISSNAPGFGNPTANTLYVIFYPASTTITLQGTASCSYFGGYHSSVHVGVREVPYVVVPRCTDQGKTQVQTMTSTTSHELIEAATDPYPNQNPAFGAVDLDHIAWELYLLGEVSDLCAQEPSSYYTPSGYPYMVARSWSNVAAAAGSDPCVPKSPGEIYYAAVPVLNDSVSFTYLGQTGTTKGVRIPLGTSKTIDVQLFSEAATAGWTVDAYDLGTNRLAFSWNKQSGNNGDVLKLTITAKSKDPQYGGELFVVIANKGADYHAYYGFVGN